ncbi:MAG: hypothetical protein Q8K60_06750, partial [Parachlamydiaceae bacterium]|nr:hypothetical protein [Parachlamydiaceae bacterium]
SDTHFYSYQWFFMNQFKYLNNVIIMRLIESKTAPKAKAGPSHSKEYFEWLILILLLLRKNSILRKYCQNTT